MPATPDADWCRSWRNAAMLFYDGRSHLARTCQPAGKFKRNPCAGIIARRYPLANPRTRGSGSARTSRLKPATSGLYCSAAGASARKKLRGRISPLPGLQPSWEEEQQINNWLAEKLPRIRGRWRKLCIGRRFDSMRCRKRQLPCNRCRNDQVPILIANADTGEKVAVKWRVVQPCATTWCQSSTIPDLHLRLGEFTGFLEKTNGCQIR